MRLRTLAGAAFLALLVGTLVPAAALARATTHTEHFSGSESSRDTNPCTGARGVFSNTFKGVVHVTELPGGSFHETTTVTMSFTFVPNDPAEPTYMGKGTFWDGENLSPKNHFTATITEHIIAKGSDGSRITEHEVAHITVQPDGTVTVEFERARLSCP
jgi:hypothetical protein